MQTVDYLISDVYKYVHKGDLQLFFSIILTEHCDWR